MPTPNIYIWIVPPYDIFRAIKLKLLLKVVKNFLETKNKISTFLRPPHILHQFSFSLSSQFVIEPGIDDCNYCCQLVGK